MSSSEEKKRRRPSAGKPEPVPGYDDAVPVANKITFFPHEEREKVVLMHGHVGKAGREKDLGLISYFEQYQSVLAGEGGDEMAALNKMGQDPGFFLMISEALDMTAPEDNKWLDKNLTLFQWFEAFQEAMSFRMQGCIWRPDVEEALGKSQGEPPAIGDSPGES